MKQIKERTIIDYYVLSVEGYVVPVLKSVFNQMFNTLIPLGYKQVCEVVNEHRKYFLIVPR